MPKCKDWIFYALVQLDTNGGAFSQLAYDGFMHLDQAIGEDRFRIDFILPPASGGLAFLNYSIFLPKAYVNDKLPVETSHLALFAHEVIHQTQFPWQRYSTWGEAQSYIFQAKIHEEFGSPSTGWLRDILDLAYDPVSFGFTTVNTDRLKKVRDVLLTNSEAIAYWWYSIIPLLPMEQDNFRDFMCNLLGP
jgi:hypothetical protein